MVILARTDVLQGLLRLGMGQAVKSFLWAGSHSLVGGGPQPHQYARYFSILFLGNIRVKIQDTCPAFLGSYTIISSTATSLIKDLQWLLILRQECIQI